jgi:FMN phosphatase YigB (HAD superfamily)
MSKQIFLDMDGVLVNLHAAVSEHKKWDYLTTIRQQYFPSPESELWKDTNLQWWETLPWMHDGKRILDMCERMVGSENVIVCTKPAPVQGSADGKIAWLQRQMPEYARRYILTIDKAWCANARTLLIDDDKANVAGFHRVGGAAIWCPREWNDYAGMGYVDDVVVYLQERIEEMLE